MTYSPYMNLRFVSLLFCCAALLLIAGCKSVGCGDCIPTSKMPYAVHDGGTTYQLIDHLSINQMIEDHDLIYDPFFSEALRKKFPDDKELIAYLDWREPRRQKFADDIAKSLHGIKNDLERSGGELYKYKIVNQHGENIEGGWLILARGRIYKKYVTYYKKADQQSADEPERSQDGDGTG